MRKWQPKRERERDREKESERERAKVKRGRGTLGIVFVVGLLGVDMGWLRLVGSLKL